MSLSLGRMKGEGALLSEDVKAFNAAMAALEGSPAVGEAHASTHQHGGDDEIATATAGANAIPKAGSGGTLAAGWIPDLSATYAKLVSPPAAADAAGSAGQIAYDGDYLYVCVDTDTWLRVAIETWGGE